MLTHAVQTYLSVRQATGFHLKQVVGHLRSFATYSDAKGQSYVNRETAIEWARQASSVEQRARRLGDVIRLARYLRAEDLRHEIPTAVFGRERRLRRAPYILSDEQICQLVQLAAQSGYRLFAVRPTARYSHCYPAPAFVSPRPFDCATTTSRRTGW